MKDKGISVEDAVKQGLGEKYTAWAWNFITEEKWVTTLYIGQ
jgi:cyclase